jgi:hypothetical protein
MLFNDIESLRFGYESHLFKVVRAQLGPNFPTANLEKTRNLLNIRRKDLLGEAVRVTADLLPEVHKIYQTCLDMIGGGLNGDLFVRQSKEYNANVSAHGKKFDLLIHSALLKDFEPDQLRFVFGHELGHVIFEHSCFPVYEILSDPKGISPDTANMLFRWTRASEISADRVGLMCCGKLGAGVTALFQTASGLSGIDEDLMIRSLQRQYEELEKRVREVHDDFSWICTHPMIPIRFKALELAALDILALRQGGGRKGFQKVDQQIGDILDAIDAA